jgi:DNA-binding LytR/AlgR family response regulator
MIKCMIVEDEPIAIRALRKHLDALDDVEIVATCSDALEARRVLREKEIDLVLLDIEMPQLTGVGLIQALDRPPRFIFTTAHRQYALQGFELDAVDYLLKPISLPRLLRALDRYRRLVSIPSSAGEEDRSIQLRVERRNVKVNLSEIRFAESVGDYIKLHTCTGVLMTKLRITELEASLAGSGFIRIHRSFIVSLGHIDAYTGNTVEIAGRVLPISRTYREAALDALRK